MIKTLKKWFLPWTVEAEEKADIEDIKHSIKRTLADISDLKAKKRINYESIS